MSFAIARQRDNTGSSGTLYAGVAFLAPALAIPFPLSMAPLLAFAAVAAALLCAVGTRAFPRVPATVVLPLGALTLWGAVTLFWSPDPARGSVTVWRIGFMFLAGGIMIVEAGRLSAADRARVRRLLVAGVGIGLVALAVECYGDAPLDRSIRGALALEDFQPFMLNRPASILAVLVWPAAAAAYVGMGRSAAAVVVAAGVAALSGTESTSVALAVTAGILVAALSLVPGVRRIVVRTVAAVALAAVLAGPVYSLGLAAFGNRAISDTTVSSMLHRLYIWDFVAQRIREKPVFGWGLEASPRIPGGHLDPLPVPPDATLREKKILAYKAQLLPLHPHNGGLQVWLELGIPGILLLGAFLALACRAASRAASDPVLSALCLAQFVAGFVVAELCYGIWQSWWMSALALAAAMMAAALPAGDARSQ